MSPTRVHSYLWFFLIFFCTINLSINVSVTSQCLHHQQSLLLHMRKNLLFNPSKSRKLLHWNQTPDCCQWNGVTCNKGLVIALDLSEEFISGELGKKSSLFSLQYLQNLNLAYNDFHSMIPSELQNLKSLRYLNLSNAGFEGQIPIEISHLTRLAILDMSTSFTLARTLKLEMPNIAMLLQNLTKITELYLDGVRISARGKEWCHALSPLQNIQVLSMPSCNLSGPIDSSLEKLQSFSIIRLAQNNFSSLVPEFFVKFSNLTTLQLNSCCLNGVFPKSIFHMQSLQVLDISNNLNLQGHLPNFPSHRSLHTLNLSNTNFTEQLPYSLHNLRQLSTLDLSKCQFNGSLPASMSELSQLVHLDLSFNKFTGTLPSLNASKDLKYLSLYHNDLRGEILFAHFEGLKNLVIIDLGDNFLNGCVPSSLFTLPSLQELMLSNNQFGGILDEFPNASSSVLEIVDLSGNNIQGNIPQSIFHLRRLSSIQLSFNKFNGTVQLNKIQRLGNLATLDLSHNNLLVDATFRDHHYQSSFPNLRNIMLASCKLRAFPIFLRNQSKLFHLDLSNNEIQGAIPNWLFRFDFLFHLNLSNNFLTSLEGQFQNLSSNLLGLDLHSNQLQGPIPIFPKYAIFLDYSNNGFSSIPLDIGNHIPFTFFLSLSNNSLSGTLHDSFCNASNIQFLDLSYNNFNKIPECLTTKIKNLRILKLGENKLSGHITNLFSTSCALRFLDLNGNLLGGIIPKTLSNYQNLVVLNLGNNMFVDHFPCFLMNMSTLRILILRSNNLHGSIECPNTIGNSKMLEIIDLSNNNFVGKLPRTLLRTWRAFVNDEHGVSQKISMYDYSDMYKTFDPASFKDTMSVINKDLGMEFGKLFATQPRSLIEFLFSDAYNEDLYCDQISVTVIYKGQQVKLVKVQKGYTFIDFSSNHFEGSIPEELMNFKGLHALNLSHNALSGHIPSSLGNLKYMESLDLSFNSLSGEIPTELAGLFFLEVLNLSFNHLVGKIPTGTQIQSFEADSFKGNKGLCGPPLNQNCSSEMQPTFETLHSDIGNLLDWNFLSAEMGFIFGFGFIIFPLIFLKSWRLKYCNLLDDMLYRIFPQVDFVYEYHEGKKYRSLRWIHC